MFHFLENIGETFQNILLSFMNADVYWTYGIPIIIAVHHFLQFIFAFMEIL